MRILAIRGSPRAKGNSSAMLEEFIRGAHTGNAIVEAIDAQRLNIQYCAGCLKCNLLGRCAIRNDDWQQLSQQILSADALVFASPVYFHHFPAPVKKILDRFRSFIQVQITERGLKHTPWHEWRKHFVLLLALGSSVPDDARPIIELFDFIIEFLGPENKLSHIIGTRLAVANQVRLPLEELQLLYTKLQLPVEWAGPDCQRNQDLLANCFRLGQTIARRE